MSDQSSSDTEAQTTLLDCPSCGEAVEARYLGTADTDEHDGHVVGWICTECDAELEEHVDVRGSSFDLEIVESAVTDETEMDSYRKCPACGDGHAPVERLGQRTRDDGVMVVGWRCLLCETDISELIGDGKVSDMVDRQPRVGEPITDGGTERGVTDQATVAERQLDSACPSCDAARLWRVTKAAGEYRRLETATGVETLQPTVDYRECRGCGWRGSR